MLNTCQRTIIRLVLGVALCISAVPERAHASTILDTGTIAFAAGGTQLGRLSRNGVPSDWASAKPFPGAINPATVYRYELFTVDSDVFSFLQISVDDPTAGLFAAAYLGSYAPNSLAPNRGLDTNYLGDGGFSGNFFPLDALFFQIVVAPHSHVVFAMVDPIAGSTSATPFRLLVEGFTSTDYDDIPDWVPGGGGSGTPVPEPSTMVLMAFPAFLFGLRLRNRRFQ